MMRASIRERIARLESQMLTTWPSYRGPDERHCGSVPHACFHSANCATERSRNGSIACEFCGSGIKKW
jgi:hypothetical protein